MFLNKIGKKYDGIDRKVCCGKIQLISAKSKKFSTTECAEMSEKTIIEHIKVIFSREMVSNVFISGLHPLILAHPSVRLLL